MNATPQQESSQPGEAEELPTPTFSGQGDSSTSEGADAIVSKSRSELLDELKPFIQETIERQVQSTKDKRISKIEKSMGRLGLLAELEEQGATIPDNLKQEMRFRDLEERLEQPAQPAPVRDDGSSQQRQAVTEAIAELNKYNLSSNDPGFIELLRGQYPSRQAFDLKVKDYIIGKVVPPKPANPSDVVQSPSTSRAVDNNNPAKLEADYQKELSNIAQTMRGDEKIRAIANLKVKYREAGLNKI